MDPVYRISLVFTSRVIKWKGYPRRLRADKAKKKAPQ